MLQYIETDVPTEDNTTIFYQMRKEVNNGFLNTLRVDLKDYQINKIEFYDDQTLHIYTTQRFDSTYEEPYSVWKDEGYGIVDSIRQLTGEVDNQQKIKLSAYITWHPEYFLRKSADGNWKFYSYAGDLSLTPNWSVYEAIKVTKNDKDDTATSVASESERSANRVINEPLYGVWCYASKYQNEAQKVADRLKELGFDGEVYISSEWSNLAKEKWYCALAGSCQTKAEAETILNAVRNNGYSDAYIKYSGDYIG